MRRSARGMMVIIGAALVVALVAPAADAGPIHAARSPGWRVFKTFGCTFGALFAVTSTGPRGAWATGRFTRCGPGGTNHVLVARWDGRSWQTRLPPNAATAFGGAALAALSNSYTWTFGGGVRGTFAWLYRNGGWRKFQLPDSPSVGSAVAFSRSNAWVFGTAGSGAPAYAARFNGHRWRRVGIPVQPVAMAAPGPGNIWAIGPVRHGSRSGWGLAHWTGSRWIVVPLPDPPSGELISAYTVDWDNAHGAWVVASIAPTVSGPYRWLLLHWTGRRWIHISYPYTTSMLGPFAHDGHGGLWIASDTCDAISCFYTDMVHYNPARGWSKPVPVGPDEIKAMRLIPRTDSLWAAGIRYPSAHNLNGVAVILKYGP